MTEKIIPDVDSKNDIEEKEVEKIESKVAERLQRKREQVEKLFIEHYGQEEGSDALKKLVDREMASGKSFDKLIKQKKKWREEATQKDSSDGGDTTKKKDDDDDAKDPFEKFRSTEKAKATREFLQSLIDKYPNEFKTKEAVEGAYKKIEAEYKETGDETRREDFKVNFEKAFKISHPDLYEQEVKEKARKEILEGDFDISNVTNGVDGQPKQKKEPKFFKPKPDKDKIADWLIKGNR